ncbi:MAG: hypothetical protein JXQ23_05400, partial [Clostridia bacterium]|nr:hypothetical protein [Clostridia bacterium]
IIHLAICKYSYHYLSRPIIIVHVRRSFLLLEWLIYIESDITLDFSLSSYTLAVSDSPYT